MDRKALRSNWEIGVILGRAAAGTGIASNSLVPASPSRMIVR